MATHPLPPDVYYRLRFLQATAETTEARAELLAAREAAAAMRARQAYQTALERAARDHGFDASEVLSWSDGETALVSAGPVPPAPTTRRRGK